MSFLGRYTDLVAAIGASIAIIMGLYELVGFLTRAETILFPPRQITLVAYKYPDSEDEFLRINARMAYANSGQPGYNSIVIEEIVKFKLGAVPREQVGQSYESFRYDSGKLVSNYISDAKPLPVNAASSESHETFFAPHPVPCGEVTELCDPNKNFLEWTKFVSLVSQTGKIEFILVGVLHDEEPVEVKCVVQFDDEALLAMIIRKHAASACYRP